ncbi:MAG: PL29 family lyase N-terminal domain-containing protein [Paludibacteraceae bacterium]|nr:PL29 family lyase N-terminal domain-containing protein [Paludibacteraceae bacterium]
MRIKNILKALPIVLGLSIFVGCEERDDVSDRNRLYRLEKRVSVLEDLCETINRNSENIKKLLHEQAKNVTISSVYRMADGYVITFSDGEFVELRNGLNGKDGKDGLNGAGEGGYIPKISVKIAEDGLHYWTIDGEWLLDENGKMVLAEGTKGDKGDQGENGNGGESITPLLKIENGYWMISYDKGKTWDVLGQATGENGKDGQDGITPQIKIESGVWYVSYDNGVNWEAIGSAIGQDGKTPSFKIEDGNLMVSYDDGITWEKVSGSDGLFPSDGTHGGSVIAGHNSVDLGLPSGKRWASCNIGANKPEETGSYFAWGELEPKIEYSETNSITFGKTVEQLLYNGYVSLDGGALTSNYDVAQKQWGKGWRMPTREEFNELLNYCNWTWTKVGASNGYLIESKVEGNDNSIFLPAAGMKEDFQTKDRGSRGWYWSGMPFNTNDYLSWNLDFSESEGNGMTTLSRRCGFPIRPIYDYTAAE